MLNKTPLGLFGKKQMRNWYKYFLVSVMFLGIGGCEYNRIYYCDHLEGAKVQVTPPNKLFPLEAIVKRVSTTSAGCWYIVAFTDPHINPEVVLIHGKYVTK